MAGRVVVDAAEWVRTFQVAMDKVVAATMSLHEESPRDAEGNVLDPYQHGFIDGATEITTAMVAVLSNMADVVKRAQ